MPRLTRAASAAVALLALLATTAPAEFALSGYTQARLSFPDDGDEDFDIRRARLKGKGEINDRGTIAQVQIDLGKLDDDDPGHVVLKDAFVLHPFNEIWEARAGYGDTIFGIDIEYSSSKRLPFERSYVNEKAFFPGQKDLGLYLTREPAGPGEPEFTIGYTNGMHKWASDDEEADAIVARAQWELDENASVAGISYMDATRTQLVAAPGDGEVARDFDNSVWGVHVRRNGARGFNFQGEYFDGEVLGVGADGWYGTIEYSPQNSEATLFYRYDEFSMAASNGEGLAQEYDRHTLGAAWDIAANERITAEVQSCDSDGRRYTDFGLQWQFQYK